MTKTKSTKRALISSALALLLCMAMLVGTTYAWFTDSVSSANNIIKSGNLDVVLEYKTDWDDEWAVVDENTKLFNEAALYEPGYTEIVYLRVSNAGSLALKYNLMVNIVSEKTSTNVYGEEFKLSDYLQIGSYTQDEYAYGANYADVLMPIMFGTRESALSNAGTLAQLSSADSMISADSPLLAGEQTSKVTALVLTMPETVGNEANHKTGVAAPEIELGITLLATQATQEYDSFDNQYDKDAEYPGISIPDDAIKVSTFEEFKSSLTNGGNYEIVAPFTVEGILSVSADTYFYNANPANVITFAQNARLKTATDADLGLYGIHIDGGGSFELVNGEFTYDKANSNNDAMLMAFAGSTLTLGEGTVIENVVSQYPAVAWAKGVVDNRATIILEGATIQNCVGGSGSIINVDRYGDVYIEKGTLISNNVSHSGNHGIVRVYNDNWDATNASTLTINGGEISNNYFSGNGMIGLYYAKMTMNGGKICNNAWLKSTASGNGFYCMVYVHSNSQFVMNGGEISGNTITDGVINSINSGVEGAITFNGGTVTNNSNTRNENKDALAAVCYPHSMEKSLVISDNANVTGTVYHHAIEGDVVVREYHEISDFFAE